MKLSKFLGLRSLSESDVHRIAMKRTGGDPNWLGAMEVFKEYSDNDARSSAIEAGEVVELFGTNDVEIDTPQDTLQPQPSYTNVRLVMKETIRVTPVVPFDQDEEAI